MNRRNFLKLLILIPVGLFSFSAKAENKRVIYADGTHDDTEALQSWIEGGRVEFPDGKEVGNTLFNKVIVLSGKVKVSKVNTERYVCSCSFLSKSGDFVFEFSNLAAETMMIIGGRIYTEKVPYKPLELSSCPLEFKNRYGNKLTRMFYNCSFYLKGIDSVVDYPIDHHGNTQRFAVASNVSADFS